MSASLGKEGKDPIFENGEEILAQFEDYTRYCKRNPIEKPELLKSGLMAGTVVGIKVPRPQSLVGFCIFLGIHRGTWYDWKKAGKYSDILSRIEDRIFRQQADGAQIDMYNASIVARRLGMTDKKEIKTPDLKGYSILE